MVVCLRRWKGHFLRKSIFRLKLKTLEDSRVHLYVVTIPDKTHIGNRVVRFTFDFCQEIKMQPSFLFIVSQHV